MPITVTADAGQHKVYGSADPAIYTYTSVPAVGALLPNGATVSFTGALSRVAGENVGTYAITQGSVANSNYTITYNGADLTITPLAVTVTAAAKTKTYGDSDPALTFVANPTVGTVLANGQTISFLGSLTRAPGENVGTYAILQGSVDNSNYAITYTGALLTINQLAVTVTADAKSKTYGDVDPALTFVSNPTVGTVLANGQTISFLGSLTRAPGENVGTYAILQGSVANSNYNISYVNGALTVNQRVLTVGGTFTVNNKEYDGTASATFASNNLTLLTIVGTDNVTLTATAVFVNKVVGTGKPVTLTGLSIAGADAANYTLSLTGLPTTTANITARVLTIGGTFTASNKVYDGTVAATIINNNLTLLTKVGADDVNLTTIAIFNNKLIGTAKIVSLTGSFITGADAANYSLSLTGMPTATADITARVLTIGGTFTAANKVYDGTSASIIVTNSLTLLTRAGTDDVTLIPTAVFIDKTVGIGKTVSLTGSSLTGADAGNYTLSLTGAPTATANISNRILTIGGTFTANNKVYDGTTSATIALNNLTLLTIAGSDNVTLTAVAVFSDVTVGLMKTVSLTGSSLSGIDASNYTLSLIGAPTATASITESGLNIAGVTAGNKAYDGTTTAALNTEGATLVGMIGTDVVGLVSTGASGTFVDKYVGSGKVVITSGFVLNGPDAYKYTLMQPTATANITSIGLTITGITADNKIYDGTTTAILNTGSAILAGVLDGDVVNLVSTGATGSFADKNVGTAKPVSTTGFTLDGADAVNYTLAQPSLAADITIASLTISGATANSKIYDGTITATLNTGGANLVGVAGTDIINLISTGATGTFPDKNVGTAKPVSTSGFAITGTSADNYILSQPALIADILVKDLTITANDLSKTYGTALTFAGTEFTITGLVQGDPVPGVSLTSTGAPASANSGTYAIIIFGGSDNNYRFIYVEGELTVNKADQIITFAQIPEGLRMTQEYELDATASSGLPVSFEISDPNIASLNGNTLVINQDGNFTVTAMQEGDQNWNPAPVVIQSVVALPTFSNITSLFTPNNDGINDYWYIPDLQQYGKLQVTVYNRYGQAVYRSEGYKNNWDGTWNGNPLPSATYYYIIKSSEKGIIKGVVNIVR
jgi:gliding motility-associated-like protein